MTDCIYKTHLPQFFQLYKKNLKKKYVIYEIQLYGQFCSILRVDSASIWSHTLLKGLPGNVCIDDQKDL